MSLTAGSTIDWLAYTLSWGSKGLPRTMMQASGVRLADRAAIGIHTWKEGKARFGYTSALEAKDTPGLSVHWNVQRPDMGVHVIFSGRALKADWNGNRLRDVVDAGANVTRLDIAVDAFEAMDIKALHERSKKRDWTCGVKKAPTLVESDGCTLYVGSRASEKYLRIYDKQAEAGTDHPWTRIELECKGEFARTVARYLVQEGTSHIPEVIRGFCDYPTLPQWTRIMNTGGDAITLPKLERVSNTDGWLIEHVAPVLIRRLLEDAGFLARWNDRIRTLTIGRVGETVDYDPFDGKADFDVH